MSIRHSDDPLVVAVAAARRAGEIILSHLGRLTREEIIIKQASDFVTRVDKESEQSILTMLRDHFPRHSFLAEESVKDNGNDGFRWIVDPLDGTTNFIHGYPVFSVSIALQHKGEPVLGVIFDPVKNELFTGEKGRGAFLNGQAVRVSDISRLNDGLITTGFPFRRKEMIDDYLRLFKYVFTQVSDLRRAGSAALDLAYLACGRCDGFFEIGLSPWDIAAGGIIIKEAGGVITDFSGGDEYLLTGNIVAGNPTIHPLILREVKKVFRHVFEK